MFRTYCSTKLAGAIAMRAVARLHPPVDTLILHPGVVQTDLGALSGPTGALLRWLKWGWESPEVCAERLWRILSQPEWQPSPGQALWMNKELRQSFPVAVDRDEAAVLEAIRRDHPDLTLGV